MQNRQRPHGDFDAVVPGFASLDRNLAGALDEQLAFAIVQRRFVVLPVGARARPASRGNA